MTAPLTPPECDLQDFPFMPLHVARLRDSDLASEEHPEACWYAVLLWSASWHQLPAASLPNNDAVMAKLVGLGRDVRTFRKHRDAALRGFILCDDGRLYHPMVAEQAMIAWEGKLQQRWRTECARIKKHNQRTEQNLPTPTYEAFLSSLKSGPRPDDVPGDVPGDNAECPSGNGIQEKEKEKGTETGRLSSVSNETGADAPLSSHSMFEGKDPKAKAWAVAKRLLTERGGVSAARAGDFVGKLMRDHDRVLDADDLMSIADACWATRSEAPIPYLTKAAAELAKRKSTNGGQIDAPSERQQVAWMEDWQRSPATWTGQRGPRPGQPGCRVSIEIQRQFGVEPDLLALADAGRAA